MAPTIDNDAPLPTFDSSKITVIYVLGGPGAGTSSNRLSPGTLLTRRSGKGTQCALLVNDFGFCHLSGTHSSDSIAFASH